MGSEQVRAEAYLRQRFGSPYHSEIRAYTYAEVLEVMAGYVEDRQAESSALRERLAALVEEWRKSAEAGRAETLGIYGHGSVHTLEKCADRLAALLSAPAGKQ